MNLVIDYGNTAAKAAVFEAGELIKRSSFSSGSREEIEELFRLYPEIDRAIISSVSDMSAGLTSYLQDRMESVVILSSDTPLPFRNLYKTADTLGYDRIAAIAGANTIFPDSNVLVIDAGTAITFDVLTRNSEFAGGNISPGREMRARALHAFTSRLPLADTEGDYPLLADDTMNALKSGIMNGIVFEINEYIRLLMNRFDDLKIILTGGDLKYFDKKLNYSIFVDSNLNLIGLNCILEYNVNKN